MGLSNANSGRCFNLYGRVSVGMGKYMGLRLLSLTDRIVVGYYHSE